MWQLPLARGFFEKESGGQAAAISRVWRGGFVDLGLKESIIWWFSAFGGKIIREVVAMAGGRLL